MKDKLLKLANSVKLKKYETYLLYFFIFAFLGWVLETIYSFFVLHHFVKRGFLYGPICPIYGYAALLLIVVYYKYKDRPLKLFTYAAIVCSIFEYYISYVLEILFHSFWWEYSNDFLNLNGRISIFYSLAWGIIAIIFIKYFYPFFKKIVDKILEKIPSIITICILASSFTVYVVDTIVSCVKYFNM